MEIIRKQINLNDFVSRVPALVPYIKTEAQGEGGINEATNRNGSWGGIMCDYTENSDTTANLLRKYYRLKEILRRGLKLKRIERSDGTFYTDTIPEHVESGAFIPKSRSMLERVGKGLYKQIEDDSDRFAESYIRIVTPEEYEEYNELGGGNLIEQVNDMIGIFEVPSGFQGSKVPEFLYFSELETYINWFTVNQGYKYVITTKAIYDAADASEKGECLIALPSQVGKNSPNYMKVTTATIPATSKYYKKTDAEPSDCCILEEWNARGGTAFWKYLMSNRGLYGSKIRVWHDRIEEGTVTIPRFSVPLLLTQVYDDNGVMTAVGEDTYSGNQYKLSYYYKEIKWSDVPSHMRPAYKYTYTEAELTDEQKNDAAVCNKIPLLVISSSTQYIKVGETYYERTLFNSVPENVTPEWPVYIEVSGKYYMMYESLYVDEGPFKTVSKLEELRTRERVYADDGSVLPFVNLTMTGPNTATADIPYRVNEVKNLGIDLNDSKTYGDYIESIVESDSSITITYYIGGEYDASKGTNISLSSAIGQCDHNGKTFEVTLKANKKWALLSVNGDWISVSGIAQNTKQNAVPNGRQITIRASANDTIETRTGSVTFGIVEKGYYEEVTFSIVEQRSSSHGAVSFDGTSIYTIYFDGEDGTTGATRTLSSGVKTNVNTGLTNYFNVMCLNSAWYVKSSSDWLIINPTRGEENISTRLVVSVLPYSGARRDGEINLVAISNPNVTRKLNVIQGYDSETGYVMNPAKKSCELEYNQVTSLTFAMQYCDCGNVRALDTSEWTYDILGGNASLFRINKIRNGFQVGNLNTTNKEDTLILKAYPKAAPYTYSYATIVGKPMAEAKKADIYLYTNCDAVDYGKSLTMGVYLVGKNGNTVNLSDWDYESDPAYSSISSYATITTDKTAYTLTIKNKNSSGENKKFDLWAYYTPDSSIRTSAVTVTLKAPEKYTYIQGGLTLADNYQAFACVQIWPYSVNGDTGSVYATASNYPGTTFPGSSWSGVEMVKDPNNRFKLKVFNGVYGFVREFKVTAKKHDGTVVWTKYMMYDVETFFTITDFEYESGLYIDIYIESAY